LKDSFSPFPGLQKSFEIFQTLQCFRLSAFKICKHENDNGLHESGRDGERGGRKFIAYVSKYLSEKDLTVLNTDIRRGCIFTE
jgi:hypothetical protein